MPINPRIAALGAAVLSGWQLAKKINYEYSHVPSIVRNSKSFIDWVKGRSQNPNYYPPYYYYKGMAYYPRRYGYTRGAYIYGMGNPRRILSRRPGMVAAGAKRSLARTRLKISRKRAKRIYSRTEGKPGGIRTSVNRKALSCANHNLGDPVGFGIKGTRKREIDHDYSDAFANALQSKALIEIPYNADEKNLNTRFGGMVNLRGVKLHTVITLKELGVATNKEYWVRWALLSSKQTKKATASTGDISQNEFFEDPAPATMGSYSNNWSIGLTEADAMQLRINRRDYCIIKEGRKFLYNESSTYPNGDRIVIDEYIPVNRQIKFDTTADIYPDDNNIWFVWWSVVKNKVGADIDQPVDFRWKNRVRLYFRTPKGAY